MQTGMQSAMKDYYQCPPGNIFFRLGGMALTAATHSRSHRSAEAMSTAVLLAANISTTRSARSGSQLLWLPANGGERSVTINRPSSSVAISSSSFRASPV